MHRARALMVCVRLLKALDARSGLVPLIACLSLWLLLVDLSWLLEVGLVAYKPRGLGGLALNSLDSLTGKLLLVHLPFQIAWRLLSLLLLLLGQSSGL